MILAQWLTFGISIIAAGVAIGHARYKAANGRQYASMISVGMASWMLHVSLFYFVLAAVRDFGQDWLYDLLRPWLGASVFENWSSAVRLHGVIALLMKEIISWQIGRERNNASKKGIGRG